MATTAIQVHELTKVYRLGERQEKYQTLRDAIVDVALAPARRIKRALAGGAPKGREEFWALNGVTFSVEQGEAIGIVGRNGAGKSTLLKVLARITEPTGGYAELHGRVASLLEVGTGFHPELSGRENIFLNAAILGMKRSEIVRQFDEIVSFAEVERFVDTPVKHYSSGMYLRLAFAVAAHLSPEILLVDEVLAVGDAAFQKKCLGKMEDVTHQGRTVLFVSHNMTAVQRLCRRAVFLQQGKVEKVGPAGEVINEYLTHGTDGSGERSWIGAGKSPGNDVVRLRAIRALGVDGKPSGTFNLTSPVSLELEYEVLQPGHTLSIGFYLYDGQGTLLAVVGDFQSTEWRDRARPTGVRKTRCTFPANLFNEGQLSVMTSVTTPPFTAHVVENDALAFRMVDDMTATGARGGYAREWPGGAIRPLVDWSFE